MQRRYKCGHRKGFKPRDARAMVQARALPAQDSHLMPQGDELELQCGTAAHPEGEQGTEGGQKREHADDGMTAAPKTLGFLAFLEF